MNPEDTPSKIIMPGLWIDMNGNPHFSLPEILAEFDIEDTPQNRIQLEIELVKMIDEVGLRLPIIRRPDRPRP